MNSFEKKLITDAFNRCFGLKDILIETFNKKDFDYLKVVLQSLSNQSSLRFSFLHENINEIINL